MPDKTQKEKLGKHATKKLQKSKGKKNVKKGLAKKTKDNGSSKEGLDNDSSHSDHESPTHTEETSSLHSEEAGSMDLNDEESRKAKKEKRTKKKTKKGKSEMDSSGHSIKRHRKKKRSPVTEGETNPEAEGSNKGKKKPDMDKSSHKASGKTKKKSSEFDNSSTKKAKREKRTVKASQIAAKRNKRKSNKKEDASNEDNPDEKTQNFLSEDNQYDWGDNDDSSTSVSSHEKVERKKKKKRKGKKKKKKGRTKVSDKDAAVSNCEEKESHENADSSMGEEKVPVLHLENDSDDDSVESFGEDTPEIPNNGNTSKNQGNDKGLQNRPRGPPGRLLARSTSLQLGRILSQEADQDGIFAALEDELDNIENEQDKPVQLRTKGGKSNSMNKSSHKKKSRSLIMSMPKHKKKGKSSLSKSEHKPKKRERRKVVRPSDMVRDDSSTDSEPEFQKNRRLHTKRGLFPARTQSLPVQKWEPGQAIKPMGAAELREMLKIKAPPKDTEVSSAFRQDTRPSMPSIFTAFPVPTNRSNKLVTRADGISDLLRSDVYEQRKKDSTERKTDVFDALSQYLMDSASDLNATIH